MRKFNNAELMTGTVESIAQCKHEVAVKLLGDIGIVRSDRESKTNSAARGSRHPSTEPRETNGASRKRDYAPFDCGHGSQVDASKGNEEGNDDRTESSDETRSRVPAFLRRLKEVFLPISHVRLVCSRSR